MPVDKKHYGLWALLDLSTVVPSVACNAIVSKRCFFVNRNFFERRLEQLIIQNGNFVGGCWATRAVAD